MSYAIHREKLDCEQFKVFEDGQYVGRIYEASTDSWYWKVDVLGISLNNPLEGVGDTRVDALAELTAAWKRARASSAKRLTHAA